MVDLKYIFILIGSLSIGLALVLIFGIKDIQVKSDASEPKISASSKVRALGVSLVSVLSTEWILYIAFLSNFCNKLGALSGYTFGTLLISDSFSPSVED